MERSFAHLLRTSRLATYDRSIPQIYTTNAKAKTVGDWGLKRNLPTVLRTRYLTIEQLDTAEHQTPFDSAAGDYLFLQRWKENFPRSRPPAKQPVQIQRDLATLSEKEFKALLQEAKARRQEWKEALAKNQVRPEDHLSFLNTTTKNHHSRPYLSATSDSVAGLMQSTAAAMANVGTVTPTSTIKVGPTYAYFEPKDPTVVQGRPVGRERQDHLVAVSGVIAKLPASRQAHGQKLPPYLQSFYVHKADIDVDGRPNVELSTVPPETDDWSLTTASSSRYYRSRLPASTSSKYSIDAASPASEQQHGGNGEKFQERVRNILESTHKPVNPLEQQ
ncbi:hypothetical protein DFQ27_003079 [Actinomortierella ambigua]|uniref:Uncharacterized protein n=1 Tax=Actinomortierella ambigua TaxID=1343610 RepID=A0A9P6U5E3_9FUNG|nr:hypothetical protein DFQ27_003079 [Actinomortierella ambigua]